MILNALGKKNISDEKLLQLIEQANHLTQGGYNDWDNNAETLTPVLQKILLRSREVQDWQAYFYTMSRLQWYVLRSGVNQPSIAFQIAELFHQDYQQHIGENISRFAGEFRVNIAAEILDFYACYPQIDDAKLTQMLEIYRDCAARFGSNWNNGDYTALMTLALLHKDQAMAEEAAERLQHVPYQNWCYICTYVWPMLGYYVLEDDFESAKTLALQAAKRQIPVKYQWCYQKCQQADEKSLLGRILQCCMKLGNAEQFHQFFQEWKWIYQDPQEREIDETYDELFHALAGEWSHLEKQLALAQQDDRKRRDQRDTPLDSLYWSLCWFCFFQLLERNGVEHVHLELDEAREWSCKEAAAYFERQADEIGAQMDRARARFGYADRKNGYIACILEGATE
ncbi:MAG: hypothetical protein HFI75_02105 [Lachnospiraceae bacterium]|nr:hypothetical protein [Lachnospiraceae bacterium]